MARRKRNRLLVPEAREALDALMNSVMNDKNIQKPSNRTSPFANAARPTNDTAGTVKQVASSLGIPYQQNGDNGNLTTRQAGRIGGQLGGSMVQKLVAMAEEQLANKERQSNLPPNN